MSIDVSTDPTTLCRLIVDTAEQEILPRFQRIESRNKADGSLVTETDLAVQRRLTDQLSALYPEVPMLGEEMPREEQQRVLNDGNTGFWCLDPLDGTSNYVSGVPCFATSLAYIQGGEPRLGIIYDPLRRECFHAVAGEGAWLNGTRLSLSPTAGGLSECIAMVDFKRLPTGLATPLASSPPYRSQRSIGSVALDWCWLAAGRVQLYLHGGAKLWDYAAGSLIHREAGGSLQLTPKGVLQPQEGGLSLLPRMAVAASDRALFLDWLEWLGQRD